MKKLYVINSHNRHGQYLIFTSKVKAINWLDHAVEKPDYKEIIELTQTSNEYYNLFTNV